MLPDLAAIGRDRLTPDEEQALAARRVAGDIAARDALVLANVPFAMDRAGKFRGGRHANHLDDLRSVAVAGLIEAADRYEPGVVSRGRTVRFVTYAAHWIRYKLEVAAVEDLATIRIPQWLIGSSLSRRLDDRTSTKAETSAKDKRHMRGKCQEAAGRALGLVARGNSGADCDPLDFVEGRRDADPAEAAAAREPDPALSRAMARLAREHPVDHRVASMIHPLDDSEPATMTEVGRAIGRHRSRVAEYYRRGLMLLREYIREERDADMGTTGWPTRREAC